MRPTTNFKTPKFSGVIFNPISKVRMAPYWLLLMEKVFKHKGNAVTNDTSFIESFNTRITKKT